MTEASKGLLGKLKNLHLPAIGIGWYRVVTSLDTAIENKQPEYVGPFPSRNSATPLPDRIASRIYFPSAQVEFHIFKPQGTKKPDKSEFERVK
ncbi:MAG: hypothetical protein WC744_02065 [Patescibacteria group bacterium]|jgi:hypothetical protein